MKKGDITCIIAYTIDEIYMIITKYPTYTYIEWNEKDRDRVPLYNESSSYPRLIGCYSHECPKKLEMRDEKRKEKLFFEKWKNIHHELLLFVAIHTQTHS